MKSFSPIGKTPYYIIVFVLLVIMQMIYSYATYFTKTITIKEKESLKNGKYGQNVVADTDGNIYSISNSIFYLFFTSTELYTDVNESQRYQVSGFGYRIPILNIFPTIISATKV